MCFDSCLKGRYGVCCFGCSTKLGIHLIALLSLLEVGVILYIFIKELLDGIFNLKSCTWLFIVFMRVVAYLSMCQDGISKRRHFMWVLVSTTVLEAIMFTIMNFGLLDGTSQMIIFKLVSSWGMGNALQILLLELFSVVHLGMFCYFCSVAYEYYTMAADDPSMIDAEHRRMAEEEKSQIGRAHV